MGTDLPQSTSRLLHEHWLQQPARAASCFNTLELAGQYARAAALPVAVTWVVAQQTHVAHPAELSSPAADGVRLPASWLASNTLHRTPDVNVLTSSSAACSAARSPASPVASTASTVGGAAGAPGELRVPMRGCRKSATSLRSSSSSCVSGSGFRGTAGRNRFAPLLHELCHRAACRRS